jgi:hypothetical protein
MEATITRKIGDCEGCSLKEVQIRHLHSNTMWFCDKCYDSEIQSQIDNVKAKVEENKKNNPINTAIATAKKLDSTVQVKTDLFNAATVAIVELKATIDADDSIENKPFALAETLYNRFLHFKQVVFELNAQIVEAGNQQKAIQVYLNQLANSLRAEEREKFKITDISYKPSAPKVPKISTIKTATKKLDKAELRKYASELGVSEFTLQMIVVQKGLTVEAAARILRHSINAAKG